MQKQYKGFGKKFIQFDMYTLRSKLRKAIFGYRLSPTAIIVLIDRNI